MLFSSFVKVVYIASDANTVLFSGYLVILCIWPWARPDSGNGLAGEKQPRVTRSPPSMLSVLDLT